LNDHAIFGLSALMALLFWSVLAILYGWPRLRSLPRREALTAVVVPHASRFIGLSFLVQGVVSPSLPSAFAAPAAYGDLIAAVLALIATLALRGGASWAIAATWVFNLWGAADLVHAIYDGNMVSKIDPGSLGGAFFIPTAVVPGLLVLHILTFRLLLRRDLAEAAK
jgi:hypothetical protein